MTSSQVSPIDVFLACQKAAADGQLIVRTSRSDKEFHFQNWFKQRLEEAGILYEEGGRNSYPDFRVVQSPEGYEVKGLAWPGRDASFDANSQVPTGFHNGRTIYYVFGRYPADIALMGIVPNDRVSTEGGQLQARTFSYPKSRPCDTYSRLS